MAQSEGSGVGGKQQPHNPEVRERAYKLFAQRKPLAEIAATTDIPIDTIRKWSSKGKWKTRLLLANSGHNMAMDRSAPQSPADIENQLAALTDLSLEEKQTTYKDIMANQALRSALTIQSVPSASLFQNADRVKKLDEVARRALGIEEAKPPCVINLAFMQSWRTPDQMVHSVPVHEQSLE